MRQEPVNVLDYEDKDKSIMKKVHGRIRLLKRMDGRVRILKKSDERLNGRPALFKKPNQMFWLS